MYTEGEDVRLLLRKSWRRQEIVDKGPRIIIISASDEAKTQVQYQTLGTGSL